ncbi:MAG: hypothetical protein V1716_04235 [Candidatus Uhrbacteria bacterium]
MVQKNFSESDGETGQVFLDFDVERKNNLERLILLEQEFDKALDDEMGKSGPDVKALIKNYPRSDKASLIEAIGVVCPELIETVRRAFEVGDSSLIYSAFAAAKEKLEPKK